MNTITWEMFAEAHAKHAGPDGGVRMPTLRKAFAAFSREALDSQLLAWSDEDKVALYPIDFGMLLTDEQKAAEIKIGSGAAHIVLVR